MIDADDFYVHHDVDDQCDQFEYNLDDLDHLGILGHKSGNFAELKIVRILMILIITSIMIIIKTDQVRWEQRIFF